MMLALARLVDIDKGGVLCHWSGLLNVGIIDEDKRINQIRKNTMHKF
jgi:hypothetical protein